MKELTPKNNKHLQTDWKIDGFIKELLDMGVDISLRVDHTATNEISFTITHRKCVRDSAIVRKCLYSAFGV